MLREAATEITQYETQIKQGLIDEDKLYNEGKIQYLIEKEIQTRNGETKTITGMTAIMTDREQALWMFNSNLNWRLDFMGRFILAQKKKVRINHQIAIMRKQYSFITTYLEKVTKNWSAAKLEAETVSVKQKEVEAQFTGIVANWKKYQMELREVIAGLQTKVVKMKEVSVKIKKDFAQLQIHIRRLKTEDQVILICKKVYDDYENLKNTFWEIQKRVQVMSGKVLKITAELDSLQKTYMSLEKKWILGTTNIFHQAQKTLWFMFQTKFGLDHDKATEAQLITKVKAHKGGFEAYTNIQEFFKLVYSTFDYAGVGDKLAREFCTMGDLNDLSKIGKIIIRLDDECKQFST